MKFLLFCSCGQFCLLYGANIIDELVKQAQEDIKKLALDPDSNVITVVLYRMFYAGVAHERKEVQIRIEKELDEMAEHYAKGGITPALREMAKKELAAMDLVGYKGDSDELDK